MDSWGGGIVDQVEGRPTLWAALLANHGAQAFGTAPMPATRLMATLDEAAELVIAARQLVGETSLPDAVPHGSPSSLVFER